MGIWDKIDALLRGAPAPPAPAPPAPAPAPPPPLAARAPSPPEAPAEEDEAEEADEEDGPRRRTTQAEDRRIEAEARGLFAKGDAAGAIALLGAQAILFAKHEPGSVDALPCLCRRCLVAERAQHEARGVAYVRDFVVARHHALFYWMPRELEGDVRRMRRSMRSAVQQRLREDGHEAPPAPRKNPFTGRVEMPPPKKRRANPFGGS